jgi:hypothetical protein
MNEQANDSSPEEINEHLFLRASQAYAKGQYEDARSLYTQLARKGHEKAQIFVGWMHSKGLGGPVDTNIAVDWFKQASAGGSAQGMFYCGRQLEEIGNYSEAIEFIRGSAGKNYGPALCRLGIMYLAGRGVTENKEYALMYLSKAAMQGNVFAKRELAFNSITTSNSFLRRMAGRILFGLAIAQSFFIALRDPFSEKIQC